MGNTAKIKESFTRSFPTYDRQATAQRIAIKRLSDTIIRISGKGVESILEIGCGTGLFTAELSRRLSYRTLVANDLCEIDKSRLPEGVVFLPGDAEQLPFAGTYNLIASSSTVQWFRDIPSFLKKIEKNLAEHGTLALSTFGPENLRELRAITHQGLSYRSLEEWNGLISACFDIAVLQEEYIPVYFDSPPELLRHLRETGVNGIDVPPLSAGDVLRLCKTYEQRYRTEKGLPLTYHVIYIVAHKKSTK